MTSLEKLTMMLKSLPGIGPKSAQRIAYSLIRTPKETNALLAEAIATIQDKVHPCSICGSYTESDPCPVCSDPMRDKSLLCIVEQPQDVVTIQAAGVYNGLFHVLGGALNPIAKVGPEDLNMESLFRRIDDGSFTEVIIATNPTEEGDATALFIHNRLKGSEGLNITRLASGLPIGGDLEYADRATLARSFRRRISC